MWGEGLRVSVPVHVRGFGRAVLFCLNVALEAPNLGVGGHQLVDNFHGYQRHAVKFHGRQRMNSQLLRNAAGPNLPPLEECDRNGRAVPGITSRPFKRLWTSVPKSIIGSLPSMCSTQSAIERVFRIFS